MTLGLLPALVAGRLLLEDVTLTKNDDQIHLHLRFRGGQATTLTIPLPPTAPEARQTGPGPVLSVESQGWVMVISRA